MAAPGRSGDAESFEEAMIRLNNELDTTFTSLNLMEGEIEEMFDVLMDIENKFEDPKDVGTTLEQLNDSERRVLPEYQKVLRMQDTLQTMNDTLSSSQLSLANFRRDLSCLEQQHRIEGTRLRQELREKQCEMEVTITGEMSSAEGNDQVSMAAKERLLWQLQTNQDSINSLLANYEQILKTFVAVNKARNAVYRRVTAVIPTFETQLDAIVERRKRPHGRRSSSLSTVMEVLVEEEATVDVEDSVMSEKGETSQQAKGEKREAETSEDMETEESPKKKKKT